MSARTSWSGGIALFLGLLTMSSSFWTETTALGRGATLGFGALASIYALWSLIARDPTKDHWALSVVGLAMLVSPWVGQFAGDGAAWTAWIYGALIMALGATAYLADDSADLTRRVEHEQRANYEAALR
ncbi:SPW repeat protein [Rhodococcus pyridinivorans]|uniref:SPW repeat protein n=1 Tax=Rhodococcus pyridinivorans TaxID=103816 RepID=UPI0039B5404E